MIDVGVFLFSKSTLHPTKICSGKSNLPSLVALYACLTHTENPPHPKRDSPIVVLLTSISFHLMFSSLSSPTDEWSLGPLIVLVVVYHMMATATYGIMASSGVFIPALLIGGIWGRIVGMLVMQWLPGVVSCLFNLEYCGTYLMYDLFG